MARNLTRCLLLDKWTCRNMYVCGGEELGLPGECDIVPQSITVSQQQITARQSLQITRLCDMCTSVHYTATNVTGNKSQLDKACRLPGDCDIVPQSTTQLANWQQIGRVEGKLAFRRPQRRCWAARGAQSWSREEVRREKRERRAE